MKLTENFTRQEFDCKDGTKVPQKYIENVTKLAENLEVLRAEINEPVLITGSGFRTRSHNDKVGGAKNSQHLTASGADINARNYTPKELAKVIEKLIKEKKMEEGGVGIYKGFVHYDIRGTKARWSQLILILLFSIFFSCKTQKLPEPIIIEKTIIDTTYIETKLFENQFIF